MYQDQLYYIRDKYVRQHDFNTSTDTGLLSVRKFGSAYINPKTLSFNPAERSVLVTTSSDGGLFEYSGLPRETSGEVKDSSTDGKKGPGSSVVFVARNRFAVLDKANQVRLSFYTISTLIIDTSPSDY